jgi:hypothetical protein
LAGELKMNKHETISTLRSNNVKFTEESFFSGFNGTRLVFENKKTANLAEKLTGNEWKKYFDKYCFEFF